MLAADPLAGRQKNKLIMPLAISITNSASSLFQTSAKNTILTYDVLYLFLFFVIHITTLKKGGGARKRERDGEEEEG